MRKQLRVRMIDVAHPQHGEVAAAPAFRQDHPERVSARRQAVGQIAGKKLNLFPEIGPAGGEKIAADPGSVQRRLENPARRDREHRPAQTVADGELAPEVRGRSRRRTAIPGKPDPARAVPVGRRLECDRKRILHGKGRRVAGPVENADAEADPVAGFQPGAPPRNSPAGVPGDPSGVPEQPSVRVGGHDLITALPGTGRIRFDAPGELHLRRRDEKKLPGAVAVVDLHPGYSQNTHGVFLLHRESR